MRFKEIHGQENLINQLIKTVKENRISHAQLMMGPEGSQKLAIAIAYAQYISCTNKQEKSENPLINGDSCGSCPSCLKIQKLIHPDLHFIYPVATTKKITSKPISVNFYKEWQEFLLEHKQIVGLNEWYEKIDIEKKQGIINATECNEIIKTLSLKAYESEYKFMIIWMAEKLFHSAAPKLLKILEEPPQKTLFLLITENKEQLLPTILSRTQLQFVPKLSDQAIEKTLTDHYLVNSETAKSIAPIVDGNLFLGIRLSEQSDELRFNFINYRKLMQLCYANKFIEICSLIGELSSLSREKLKQLLTYGLEITRSCLLINYDSKHLIKIPNNDELLFVEKFSPFVNPNNAMAIIELLEENIHLIQRNVNEKIVLTEMSLKFIKLLRIKK